MSIQGSTVVRNLKNAEKKNNKIVFFLSKCHSNNFFKKFQRSINKTCCSSEDKFITEDTMAKVLQFIQKLCLQVNKFVYARARKCERKIGIG